MEGCARICPAGFMTPCSGAHRQEEQRQGLAGTAPAVLPTSLASMPLFTDQVVWKYSSILCFSCCGRRWTRMKSLRSFMRVW